MGSGGRGLGVLGRALNVFWGRGKVLGAFGRAFDALGALGRAFKALRGRGRILGAFGRAGNALAGRLFVALGRAFGALRSDGIALVVLGTVFRIWGWAVSRVRLPLVVFPGPR